MHLAIWPLVLPCSTYTHTHTHTHTPHLDGTFMPRVVRIFPSMAPEAPLVSRVGPRALLWPVWHLSWRAYVCPQLSSEWYFQPVCPGQMHPMLQRLPTDEGALQPWNKTATVMLLTTSHGLQYVECSSVVASAWGSMQKENGLRFRHQDSVYAYKAKRKPSSSYLRHLL